MTIVLNKEKINNKFKTKETSPHTGMLLMNKKKSLSMKKVKIPGKIPPADTYFYVNKKYRV